MISVAKKTGSLGLCARWVAVLVLAAVGQGQIYTSMEAGDFSGRDFTAFVLMIFLVALCLSLKDLLQLVAYRRRARRLPGELDGEELGAVLAGSLKHDRSPVVGVPRSMYEQYRRNPESVDEDALIALFHERLSTGPHRTKWLAGLCVTMGFVGTSFGLLGALNGLSGAVGMAEGDGARLMELLFAGPTAPMASLGGAYLSTLAGLACGSIVLRSLAQVQQSSINALTAEMTEMVKVYVKPSFRRLRRLRRHGTGRMGKLHESAVAQPGQ